MFLTFWTLFIDKRFHGSPYIQWTWKCMLGCQYILIYVYILIYIYIRLYTIWIMQCFTFFLFFRIQETDLKYILLQERFSLIPFYLFFLSLYPFIKHNICQFPRFKKILIHPSFLSAIPPTSTLWLHRR